MPSDDTVKAISQSNSNTPPMLDLGPLSRRDAYRGIASDKLLMERILGFLKKPHEEFGFNGGDSIKGVCESGTGSSLELNSLSLNPENVARVVLENIVVGNNFGNVGFWDVDSSIDDEEEDDGLHLYDPHHGVISGISIHQHSFSKIFTSCYLGFIRLMDAEKEVFDLAHSSDDSVYSISQRSDDVKCLYFSEGHGGLNIWDERIGKCSTQWNLHEHRIFNSKNYNIMATSSSDGTACVWDLRSINVDQPKTLMKVSHKRAVQSAYFSPSGSSHATTSMDNTVGIGTGVNFDHTSMIKHDNLSGFRAVWDRDDSHIFIGNMKRGVDVISLTLEKTIFTLQSPHMSAVPRRFDAHPSTVGMLVGATCLGQVYMWTLG